MTSNIGFLILLTINIFLGLGVAILWIRTLRPPKEDPRLSRGLQLLQSKIAILEDLSDRTEKQVGQLVQILDERAKFLRAKILHAEETMLKVEQSMAKSLDVAKIFQDKIPHEEIVERQQTSKYVQAAKLAHEGKTIEEIAHLVDLPLSEVEFISKVNRDELTFDPELLPEWAKETPTENSMQGDAGSFVNAVGLDLQKVFQEQRLPDLTNMKKVEEQFKMAVREQEEIERQEVERRQAIEQRAEAIKHSAMTTAVNMAQTIKQTAGNVSKAAGTVSKAAVKNAEPLIRKVQFPRITIDK